MAVRKVRIEDLAGGIPDDVRKLMDDIDREVVISLGRSVYRIGQMTRKEFVPLFDKFADVVKSLVDKKETTEGMSVTDLIELVSKNREAIASLVEIALGGADNSDLEAASIAQFIAAGAKIYEVNFSSTPLGEGMSQLLQSRHAG